MRDSDAIPSSRRPDDREANDRVTPPRPQAGVLASATMTRWRARSQSSNADAMRASLQRRADRCRTGFSLLTASDGEVGWSPELEAAIRAQHGVIGAQRDELLRWRDGGRMSDDCFRGLQHELDLEERTLPGG
jgi:hypothetical protein